jgi:carbon-monoxide dehydrogenase medium subunit
MTLPNLQDYFLPDTTDEALALLKRFGASAMIVAGGTFVHGLEARGLLGEVGALVDIQRLGLGTIGSEGDGTRMLGATATLEALAQTDFVRADPAWGCVRDALACPPQQIRNVGTVGGCVAAAAPLYDLPAALLALDGRVRAIGSAGRREIALGAFFRGLFENALGSGELITSVVVPASAPYTASAFLKLEANANDLAIVSVAVRLTLGAGGTCVEPRVVVGGGVGETYVRAARAEAALAGQPAGAAAFATAAAAVAGEIDPVADHRGSAEYRRYMATVFVRRALGLARERLG